MIIILFGICILRTVLLFTIMPRWHDIRGIAVTYPITWGMTALCMMIYHACMEHRSEKQRRRVPHFFAPHILMSVCGPCILKKHEISPILLNISCFFCRLKRNT